MTHDITQSRGTAVLPQCTVITATIRAAADVWCYVFKVLQDCSTDTTNNQSVSQFNPAANTQNKTKAVCSPELLTGNRKVQNITC